MYFIPAYHILAAILSKALRLMFFMLVLVVLFCFLIETKLLCHCICPYGKSFHDCFEDFVLFCPMCVVVDSIFRVMA